jgi:CD109 antigen
LITFLEDKKLGKNNQNTIDKALDYIVKNIENLDDNYSLAIATYALQISKHESKDLLLAKLDSKSENKGGMKHWAKEIPASDSNNPWSYRPNSVNVEMSAYALQAFVEANRDADAVPIMKWLVTQRNSEGGFQSTQDTVVGLQALAKLAAKVYVPNSKIEILLKHGNDQRTNLNVNEENALVLQKNEISSEARNFEVTAREQGFSILQLSYKYNKNVTGEWPRFIVEPEVHKSSNKDFLHLVACTSFVPDDFADKSNMAVMEVSLPSGFTFDSDSLTELKATEKVKKIETKEGETIVVIYFDDLSVKKICPEVKAYRTHSVAKQKPVPIIVYDY